MDEPIRVLQCFGRMGRGGAETLIMEVYRKIDRRKVQFDFVVHTKEKCAFDDEIVSLGGRIFQVPQYTVLNHFSYVTEWQKLLRNNYQTWVAVHGHMFTTSAIYFKEARKVGLFCIAHSHSSSWSRGFQSIIKKIIQYPIRYRADYFFACSMQAGEWLFGKRIIQQSNFRIINNGIDTNKFKFSKENREKVREELDLKNKFVVGHVGRFSSEKNHNLLIDIFSEICIRNDKAVLLLVGDGSLRKETEKKVKDLGLSDKVIFTGVRKDVPELLQAMDVFLFPSLFEGLGIVAVEAQAAGLPIIVSETIPKEAFLTNLIHEENLCSSPEVWAENILKYSNGYERYDTSDVIRSQGFDISGVVEELQSFYIKIDQGKILGEI